MYDPGAEYLTGWGRGKELILVRRDPNTMKRVMDRVKVDWYFYISDQDYEKVESQAWDGWIRRGWCNRVERDPVHNGWWRVYVDKTSRSVDLDKVFARMDNPDLRSRWSEPLTRPEPSRAFSFPKYRDSWGPVHKIVDRLEKLGVEPMEADLSPLRRFLVDNDVKFQQDYNVCFLDFETDDRKHISQKEQSRILSVAWEGSCGDSGYMVLEEDSDESEKRFLKDFVAVLKDYDVLAAWNGDGFDFQMLIARCRVHRVGVNWRQWLWADPLPVFRKRFIRQQVTSYALDNVGEKVLGIKKIDWRPEFRKRHPGVALKIWNMWRLERDMLETYNRRDVEILRKLEDKTRFLEIERLQNRVAGIFAGDFTVSNKIDTMILRRGRIDGHHFRTRYWSAGGAEKFVGAFVFEPVVGIHSNVGVFDFKSLYPSMIRSFNISPETYVRVKDRESFDDDSLCRCPSVKLDDGTVRGGATYRTDREGFVSQMFVDTTDRRNEYTKRKEARIAEVGTKDDPEVKLCENLAYAFKSLGLSFYGEIGHSTGRYYDVEMAESITLSGQYFIKKTEEYAAELGYRVLAGDTDSVFIQLISDDEDTSDPEKRAQTMLERGAKLVSHCQKRYLEILKEHGCVMDWAAVQLEFEDVYDRIAFMAKKRYAGKMLVHKGQRTEHVEVKGLELMRSDYTDTTRDLQRRVLDAILLDNADAEAVAQIVESEQATCMSGKLSKEQVTISKSLTKDPDEYKTEPLHVRLARWVRDNTSDFYMGIKIGYVVTGHKPTLEGVLAEHYDPEHVGYAAEYYWDKVIYPPTSRILEVCFPEHDWKKYSIKELRRRNVLIERYSKWLGTATKRQAAIDRIAENKGGILRPSDIDVLRARLEETRADVNAEQEKRRTGKARKKGAKVWVHAGEASRDRRQEGLGQVGERPDIGRSESKQGENS